MRMGMKRYQRPHHRRSHQLRNETALPWWKTVLFRHVMNTRMTREEMKAVIKVGALINRTKIMTSSQVQIGSQDTVDTEFVGVGIILLQDTKNGVMEKIGTIWAVVDARIEMIIREVVESMIKEMTMLQMNTEEDAIRNLELEMITTMMLMRMVIDRIIDRTIVQIIIVIVTIIVIITVIVFVIILIRVWIVIIIEIVVEGRKMKDIITAV
jgi:hypothetical protein